MPHNLGRRLCEFVCFGTLAMLTACDNDSDTQPSNSAETSVQLAETQMTPLVADALAPPVPVLGSDDRYHLVYELQLTNATALTWQINQLEILNAETNETLLVLADDKVAPRIELLGSKASSNTIAPGQAALVFLTFSVDAIDAVPAGVKHRLSITVPGGIPPEFSYFVGQPAGEQEYTQIIAPLGIEPVNTLTLGPPLTGDAWVAADGCCTAKRHVRGTLAINGKIRLAQRYAIDWEKLDSENRLFVGDKSDVNNWYSYGEDVLAVADATVITAVNEYQDQIPGELPGAIELEEVDGNHIVLDLGEGKYAFYAHLIKDSLTVAAGDTVKKGQVIGRVGNTGNSSSPHLHFHVMDTPSTLASNGLPYLTDRYDLIKRGVSTEAFDEAEATGVPLQVEAVARPGLHENDMILDQSVVNFE